MLEFKLCQFQLRFFSGYCFSKLCQFGVGSRLPVDADDNVCIEVWELKATILSTESREI